MSARQLLLPVLAATVAMLHNSGWAGEDGSVPVELRPWLTPQQWQRDVDLPVVPLGSPGDFDDTHVFAPCVAFENGRFRLWYCGSSGTVAQRVFKLGLAQSSDGRNFTKHPANPVYDFGDGKHSVLTPTLLRDASGNLLREDGKLRMWFSATDFADTSGLHTLHEATSSDGLGWSEPSGVLLTHVYTPTIIKEGSQYRMWYTDVSSTPWSFRYAESRDGRRWRVREQPVLELDQAWEKENLFYTTVVKCRGVYLMWYGSYWKQHSDKTALGLAASLNGWNWYKNPHNPVFTPAPDREWESHYTTSQSVIRLPDGSWRIWYGTRKKPPFVNKYFAVGTARWDGAADTSESNPIIDAERLITEKGESQFADWRQETRRKLRQMLGIPETRVPLEPEPRGRLEFDDFSVEKWTYTSEPGSRVPAVLYLPKPSDEPLPAVVLTFGHGGSKSHVAYNYLGQLYARLGIACLAADPIGEEERHITGKRGTRAHDPYPVHRRAWEAGRPIMGKLVFDTMRGIDFLLERDDVDHQRIGVAGNSLGGAKAGWMATLDDRLKTAIVSGWAFDDVTLWSKYCTSTPNSRMREMLTWKEYASLAAPDCALLVMNGDADVIIDRAGTGAAWDGTRRAVEAAAKVSTALGKPGAIRCWFEPQGGHRPYPAHKAALDWLVRQLQPNGWSPDKVAALPETNFGDWAKTHNIKFEQLYGTPLHLGGATVVDMNIVPIPDEKLAVLEPSEIGSPQFTLEGWLDVVARPETVESE